MFSDPSLGATVEPEIAAVMNWTQNHKFVTSVALQGGALVAKYPLNKPKAQGKVVTGQLGVGRMTGTGKKHLRK